MNDLREYNVFRPFMYPGDKVSFEGSGFVSTLIKILSKRSHVASIVRFPWDRVGLMEADQGEVNARALSRKLKYYKGKAYWHPLRDEFKSYRKVMDEFLWNQLGIKYDFKSLFANMLGRVNTNADQYFCSELCGDAIKVIPRGILEDLTPNKYVKMLLDGVALRPEGIAKLPIFKKEVRIL